MQTNKTGKSVLTGATMCLSAAAVLASSGNHNAFGSLMRAGRDALRQKQWASAASYFRNATGWENHNADAHAALGTAYLHLAQTQRAGDEFKAALRFNRHNAEAERGLHLLRSPDEEENAFKALTEQVKNEPNNADLRATYAEELVERSRFEEAQKEAEGALQIKPKLGHAYCALGRVAAHNGKDEEARKDFSIAIKADKRDDDAWGGLGDLAMKAKDYSTAIMNYQHAVSIVSEERQWHEKLRDACKASGDAQGAEQQQALLDGLAKAPADTASK